MFHALITNTKCLNKFLYSNMLYISVRCTFNCEFNQNYKNFFLSVN